VLTIRVADVHKTIEPTRIPIHNGDCVGPSVAEQ
jgi:hypothetical protein